MIDSDNYLKEMPGLQGGHYIFSILKDSLRIKKKSIILLNKEELTYLRFAIKTS